MLARQFDEMEDEYLRERKADLEQVVERLLRALAREAGAAWRRAPGVGAARDFGGEDPLVLVANDIAPADMLQFKRSVFTGFVTDVGGRTSHTAIVARSMDIPAVVGAREASRLIRQDDWVVIDGDAGVVIVDPSPIVLEEYRFRQRQSELERERLDRLRHTPAVTLDGERVELLANIELPGDAAAALEAGAVGVGLFRSEFLFMNRGGELPGEDEQFEAYRAAVEAMKGLPVTIRTVDIGADKPLERMSVQRTASRARAESGAGAARDPLEPVGARHVSAATARHPARQRLRQGAAARSRWWRTSARSGRRFEALARAKQQLDDAGRAFTRRGGGRDDRSAGCGADAATLPAALRLRLDRHQRPDPVHAGDRSSRRGGGPSLRPVASRRAAARRRRRSRGASAQARRVSVCGEMAGDPAFTELLLAMGLRSFSMHPAQIASIKQRVLRADTRRLGQHLQRCSPATIRKRWPCTGATAVAAGARSAARRQLLEA